MILMGVLSLRISSSLMDEKRIEKLFHCAQFKNVEKTSPQYELTLAYGYNGWELSYACYSIFQYIHMVMYVYVCRGMYMNLYISILFCHTLKVH